MPSAVGYQPTLATEMGAMQERITSTKKDRLHQFKRFMYLRMTLQILHQQLPLPTWMQLQYLSRKIAELGNYPAVDPLDSTSRILTAEILR